ncbi:DoxX family protein [Roseateles violae]|uniref:DoxX family protein n=1 Tax=Roseateles violae TaxID=3058042 RepID=A0ABT8DQB4_9BURK|nr:DoxX family protein [Pelomonas sp. PFR6]MDN3920545.1 DoxX family protein [Pelomonas sp. PFR6]
MTRIWKTWACGAWRCFSDPGLAPQPARLPAPLRAMAAQAQSLGLLLARLYVARVFWLSGLTKLRDWSVTLALFEDEYHVPLLPPELAAWLGTAGELGLSVLLALGLCGRFAAAGLSVVNLVAVLSLAEIAPAALLGHQLWGVLLIAVLLWGAGRWSVDGWIVSRAGGS